MYAAPNDQNQHRLGLAIHRRVGNSVTRNRVKRLLREAFRIDRQNYPLLASGGGCDLVVQAKPDEAATASLETYRSWLAGAVQSLVKELDRRAAKAIRRDGPTNEGDQ